MFGSERQEVAYVGDLSETAETARIVAAELAANARAGYRSLLLPVPGPGRDRPLDPAIRRALMRGEARLHPADEKPPRVRLALFHEPPAEGSGLEEALVLAEESLIVLHRPVADREGKKAHSLKAMLAGVARAGGGRTSLAPAWPELRRHLESLPEPPPLAPEDWRPVIAPAEPAPCRRPRGLRPLVGRHARPRPAEWPESFDELLHYFPLSDHLEARLLGLEPRLLDRLYGSAPGNWILYPHGSVSTERFLGEIDFFLAAPNDRWPLVPTFAMLEALAAGVVPLLPPPLAETFAGAAAFVRPGFDCLRKLSLLHRDAEAYRDLREAGRQWLAAEAAPERHAERLGRRLGRPKLRPSRRVSAREAPQRARIPAKKRLLFTATNGIGLGHLTQLLAIARRLPPEIEPIFATMSQAISAVRSAGHVAHYFPDYRYAETPYGPWNRWLEAELELLIELYGIEGLVFDGVIPYDGILRSGARRGRLPMIWVRIPMWKRALWDDSVERAKYFDLVLDTGEIADAANRGAVIPFPDRSRTIPPLLLCRPEELLSREEARRRLGLDPQRPAVLLQLGAGNNQELAPVIDHLLSSLEKIGPFSVVNAEWLISEHALEAWPEVKTLRDFPNALYYRAFDFVVSAVGYNTFHELICYGIPALLVPNEEVMTDDQLGRARFAEAEGLAHVMRTSELDRALPLLRLLADPEHRAEISERCRSYARSDGAEVAAGHIARLLGVTSLGDERQGAIP